MLTPPIPYMGGKRRVAPAVWARIGAGDLARYVEPFAGGLAVLLGRPQLHGHEVVGDAFCLVANFWRAVAWAPDDVAMHMDWPVIQVDLVARRAWLKRTAPTLEAKLREDPLFFDPRAAGWWAWVMSVAMGEGREHNGEARPTTGSKGVCSSRIRRAPRPRAELEALCQALAERLKATTILSCDWTGLVTPGALWSHTHAPAPVGVFLDPPYLLQATSSGRPSYAHHGNVALAVRAWALANGDNPRLRIALCGYASEHEDAMPASWERLTWTSVGYAKTAEARAIRTQERIWFSPHCLRPGPRALGPLFDREDNA